MLTTALVYLLFVVLCFPYNCVGEIDLTEDENAFGVAVVRATIARLDNAFGTNNSFWDVSHSIFMRTLAYVESVDGNNLTQNSQHVQGIWQVPVSVYTAEVNLYMQYKCVVNTAFNDTDFWDSIVDNLQKPLYSAIGARLVLLQSSTMDSDNCNLDMIPNQNSGLKSMKTFWETCYHMTPVDISLFGRRYTALQNLNESECNVDSDLAFVLDSSGSIGLANWELVKNYVSNVTDAVSAEGHHRVAIVTYSDSYVVNLNFTSDQSQTSNVIRDLNYIGGYTNTAEGLCQLLDQVWRKDVLNIAIILTDGRSNRNSMRCGNTSTAAQYVHDRNIMVFVVGVTDRVKQEELELIATSSDYVSLLDDFGNTLAFDKIRNQQTYHICFQASSITAIDEVLIFNNFNASENGRYNYVLPEVGLTIRLCVQDGQVVVYASFTITNPSRALNSFSLDAVSHSQLCEDLFVMGPSPATNASGRRRRQSAQSSTETLFVSIEGVTARSSFTLETTLGDNAQNTITCGQDPCGRNTICTDDPIGYSCDCVPGYRFNLNILDCLDDINECEQSPCNQFASCLNTNGSFVCSCLAGYKGDGIKCILDENSDLKFYVTIGCSVGGGVILLVVVVAALIKIYKVLTAKSKSPYHSRGHQHQPAEANLNFDQTSVNSGDVLLLPENMY